MGKRTLINDPSFVPDDGAQRDRNGNVTYPARKGGATNCPYGKYILERLPGASKTKSCCMYRLTGVDDWGYVHDPSYLLSASDFSSIQDKAFFTSVGVKWQNSTTDSIHVNANIVYAASRGVNTPNLTCK